MLDSKLLSQCLLFGDGLVAVEVIEDSRRLGFERQVWHRAALTTLAKSLLLLLNPLGLAANVLKELSLLLALLVDCSLVSLPVHLDLLH